MKLFTKLRTLFAPEPVVTPAPLYSDEEFLEFVAAQARKRGREEQAAQQQPTPTTGPLGNAA